MRVHHIRNIVIAAAALATAFSRVAASMPESFEWSGNDSSGKHLSIPAADRPTVIALVRPGQSQSRETIEQLRAVLKSATPQLVLIVSGENAAAQARQMADEGAPGSVISDPDYALSGILGAHVWPELLVVDSKAKCIAQLPGLRQAGANEVIAYLELASGKISLEQLQARLTANPVVSDEDGGTRRLEVVRQLIGKDRLDDAAKELDSCLPHLPGDGPTQLLAARVLLALNRVADADAVLKKIPEGSVPAAQKAVVVARARIMAGEWAEALALLETSVKLNPDPSEAQYLIGVALQHQGKFAEAAAALRAAAEATLSNDLRVAAEAPTP